MKIVEGQAPGLQLCGAGDLTPRLTDLGNQESFNAFK
ncbi:hypothetical protein CLOLEP_02564 [[Clostridium] leptum DSM 753]|uniref:Uncharacterized protein n=1 Tax=[Clostridium] leptum DSM 753 TaxID=428125 RepID=A7VVF2_9FIRM|nr:hypothetical protein CLOLEP_02564 [[Clostridium] leptum DSM 753]